MKAAVETDANSTILKLANLMEVMRETERGEEGCEEREREGGRGRGRKIGRV